MIGRRWVNRGAPNYDFTINSESPQAKGLVGWWPTLEKQGRILHEFVRGNFCIFPGGAENPSLLSTAERGHVLYYDGNDYNTSVKDSPISGNNPFSLVCWANTDDTGTTAGDAFQFVAFQIGLHNATGKSAYIAINEDAIKFQGFGIVSLNYFPPSPINGVWKHIVATYEGGGAINLYVDGNFIANGTDVDAFDIAVREVQIGSGVGSGGPWRYFEGSLDDCRIYNRALTPIEVYQLYAPQTRWELYQPIQRDVFAFVAAAAGLGPVYPGRNHPSRNVLLRL